MNAMADLSIPRNRSLAGARARGFEARLAGRSIYSNPYGDAIERAADEGRRPGWTYAFLAAWVEGWRAADSLVEPSR